MTAPPYVLTYEAPAGCPAEDGFRRDVANRLRAGSPAANLRLDVTIAEDGGGYGGTVTAVDDAAKESARRRIVGKSCAEVARALAFLVGLLIELNGHLDPEVEPAPPPLPPPPEPAPAPNPEVSPAPVPDAEATPSVRLSALVLADARSGLGPTVDPSGELGVEVALGPSVAAPALRVVGFGGGGAVHSSAGSAQVWFGGGRVELCPLRTRGTTLVFRLCAGGEAGAVYVRGDVPLGARAVTVAWGSAEVTLQVRWFPTKKWFVEVGGGPLVPLDRTRYYFEPDTTLYEMPVVAARLALGLGWQF